jgi:hypothetical protein
MKREHKVIECFGLNEVETKMYRESRYPLQKGNHEAPSAIKTKKPHISAGPLFLSYIFLKSPRALRLNIY